MDWGYVSESSPQVNAINTEEEKGGDLDLTVLEMERVGWI